MTTSDAKHLSPRCRMGRSCRTVTTGRIARNDVKSRPRALALAMQPSVTMKPLPHRYEVRIAGGPLGYATLASIVLRPRIVLPAGADGSRVRRALEKAEKACLVSASLSTPIRIEPEIAG